MERQFLFTRRDLINRANINCAQLLSRANHHPCERDFPGHGVTLQWLLDAKIFGWTNSPLKSDSGLPDSFTLQDAELNFLAAQPRCARLQSLRRQSEQR